MSIESRPADAQLSGELYPAIDRHDETVVRFDLYGIQPHAKMASAEIRTPGGLVANGAALMGMAMGMPQHNGPHCHAIIEATGGPMDNIIKQEAIVIEEREQRWNGVHPEDAPKIITGNEVVANLDAMRRRKLSS